MRPVESPFPIGHAHEYSMTFAPALVRLHAWLLALVLIAWAQMALAQPITITPVAPRAFGYTVGDRIERRIDIATAPPWSFAQASLPKPGRVNAWFELAEIAIQTDAQPAGTRTDLRLTYQLLNSPAQPTVLLLPRLALRFEGGADPVERDVAPAEVFAAPLLPAAAAGSSLDTPRADRKPQPIPVDNVRSRLAAYPIGAAVLLLSMLIARQFAQRRRAGPFVRACRELRRIAHAPADGSRAAAAMRVVHRALDETAGHAVFLDNVDSLFASPHRAPLRERTRAFLGRSRDQFFAGRGEPLSLEELRDLARAWRSLEAAHR
jgi:mxaA protein